MPAKINVNTASPKELTQLPGIAKNMAYRIVNHRDRHGFFTHWEELNGSEGVSRRCTRRNKSESHSGNAP